MSDSNWTPGDSASLSSYLSAHPNVMRELRRRIPAINRTGTVEQAAITGAAHAGGEAVLDALEDMQYTPGGVRETGFIEADKD